MAPSRDIRADALPSGCVDGSRLPDGDRILPHRYHYRRLRRQCVCGKRQCLAAEDYEATRNPDGVTPW